MGGGIQKIVKGSPPKALLKDIIKNKITHTRRVLLIIDTSSQMLNVWKQVSLKIFESKIFLGLAALGDRYAVCKSYGITTSFEPACRAYDFFICSEVQKLVIKIIKQHESAN